MIKKFFIGFLLFLFLFSLLEIFSFYQTKKENDNFKIKAEEINKIASNFETKYAILKPFETQLFSNSYKNENYKKSILWFGCSFANGAGLEEKQTPCYKISKLTNFNCLNKSSGGTGTQFMYYQLKQNDFKDKNPSVDYIIYTFIWDHLQRLYNFQVNPLIYMHNLRYSLHNGKLKEINPKFNPLYSSFIVKRILNKKNRIDGDRERQNFRLFNRIMKETVKIAKEKYPNSKFILLEFPQISDLKLPDYEIKKLETYGIIVIRVKDFIPENINISDEKYWLDDNLHPSEELWNLFLPQFVEKHIN